jgi:hypothetical protein
VFVLSPNLAFFDPPTWWYNVLTFVFSVAGIGLGTWALTLAYWQIGRVITAANAARDAAQQARTEIRQISTIVDVSKLAQLSRELHYLIRDGKFREAAIRAQELRTGVAEIQATPIGKKLQTNTEWKTMAATITQVQDVMELRESSEHDENTRACLGSIGLIDEAVHAMMAQAAHVKESPHGTI